MNQSTDTDKRPIILYIIIAIALVAALVLGVWWAKNRANQYAQQPITEQVSQPQGESVPEVASQPPVQSPDPAETASVPPAPTMTQPEPSTPVIVPATGAEQVILPITSVSLFVFAALSYIRARRRLVTQAIRFTL